MKTESFFHTPSLIFCALTLACGSGSKDREPGPGPGAATDSNRSNGATASAESAGVPCPRTGRWAVCSVEKRLEQSGFVARKTEGESPARAGFSIRSSAYMLGRARLEVFIYPDEAALGRDLAKLDTTISAPRGQTNDWEIPPRFIRSANLAAVLLTRNEQQAERVTLALTAGPPQSGR